ncbi:MAG: DUF89 family protein [Candidatus Omnitrophota bacterium]|jgi:uncharacterized protein with ATP-grasp and redox domains|nr:MAG: DUF89 family protein [Candidatus Omnitrophota bacterium]
MKTYYDCIPCFVRQALESIRFVTDDEVLHEKTLREVLRFTAEMDLRESPPMMGRRIHRLIKQITGIEDPYRRVKDHFNRFVLRQYPELKQRIESSPDPLETAVRLSIAGNIIDFGPKKTIDDFYVQHAIEHSLSAPLITGDLNGFQQAMNQAKRILYLGDNAGEIVFDRLLIELLPTEKITFAVRGFPIINDATMEDAITVGLPDIVEVIDNGADAPGTILELCSEDFRERFTAADLIIAKGQGNYETLSQTERNIYFVLKAKCPVIAAHLGCEVGALIFKKNDGSAEESRRHLDVTGDLLERRGRMLTNY